MSIENKFNLGDEVISIYNKGGFNGAFYFIKGKLSEIGEHVSKIDSNNISHSVNNNDIFDKMEALKRFNDFLNKE